MPLFLRPGQQLRKFTIYRKDAKKDAKGRVSYKTDRVPVGEFWGTITQASQTEREQWKQMGHPITHRVVVRGPIDCQAEDYIELAVGGLEKARVWSVQSKHDPMEISYFHTLYCEERNGVGM